MEIGFTASDVFDIIGNIQIAISTVSIIVAFFAFFLGVRGLWKHRFFRIFSDEILHKNKSRKKSTHSGDGYGAVKARFLHYIPHSFSQIDRTQRDNNNVPYGDFVNQIKDNKLTFIVGSSGIGKSILMQRLAFAFRKKFHKKINRKSLDDYDILFYRVSGAVTLENLLGDIESRLASGKHYSVYIDGLDELGELNTQTGEQVLTELINGLVSRRIVNKCRRVIVSLCPEIMKNGFSNFRTNVADAEVWTVGRFTPEQAVKMYRTESKLANEPKAQRKTNSERIAELTRDNKLSIFGYPFIITWAADILSSFTDTELSKISWYDALGKIIENDLKREFKISVGMDNKILLDDTQEPKYIKECYDFIKLIAEYMALNDVNRVARSTIVEYGKKQGNDISESVLVSRRLLNYVEWSEREGNSGETYYEFIHNMVYWRVLCDVLSDLGFPYEKRTDIFNREQADNSPFIEMYRTGIFAAHKSEFKQQYVATFLTELNNGVIKYVKTNDARLHDILRLLPGTEKIYIYGYTDEPIFLDDTRVNDYLHNGKLNLSLLTYGNNIPLALGNLSILDEFDLSGINKLCLARNELTDISALSSLTHLNVLDISRNPLDCAKAIAEQLPDITIDTAVVSVSKSEDIPPENSPNVKKWLIAPPSTFSSVYKNLYELMKQNTRADMDLAGYSDFGISTSKLHEQTDIMNDIMLLNIWYYETHGLGDNYYLILNLVQEWVKCGKTLKKQNKDIIQSLKVEIIAIKTKLNNPNCTQDDIKSLTGKLTELNDKLQMYENKLKTSDYILGFTDYWIGVSYEKGIECEQNTLLAQLQYLKSLEHGYVYAQNDLERLKKEGF